MINRIIATYLVSNVTNVNPITDTAGITVPVVLNNFLVFVLVNKFFLIIKSDNIPEKFIINHRLIYGNVDKYPF